MNHIKQALSGLVGCTVMAVEAVDDGFGDVWPVIIFSDAEGNLIQGEISCDEEGNGPGHINLGLIKVENPDFYHAINGLRDWNFAGSGI